jgi:hypothetical protein
MSDYQDFDLSALTMTASGMDSYLDDTSTSDPLLTDIVASEDLPDTVRVSSVNDLKGFRRIAANTLIRKSENDFWILKNSEEGWVIERQFDADGNPLKVTK